MMYQEEYSTIGGTYPDGRHRAITVLEDGVEKVARLDMSKPVTLQRMHEVCERLRAHTGVEFNYLRVEHHIYEFDVDPNDEVAKAHIRCGDYPGRKVKDKTYQFWYDRNRLLIWDHGTPVYENDNGEICRDADALADCYC
jgi:hypothetical protein